MSYFKNLKTRAVAEESGFSLIELLVVVLIIGILAAVMIPRFISQRDSAKNGQAITTIREAETALNSYFNLNDESFGADADAVVTAMTSNNAPGREKGLYWTANGTANAAASNNADFVKAGNDNNPKEVFIEDVVASRYGGVSFCVGSQGTKNYCATILGNDGTKKWTLIGNDNSLGSGLVVTIGNPSTLATVTAPTVTAGPGGNATGSIITGSWQS